MHSNYGMDRASGIHRLRPNPGLMFMPGAVYQLKQIGGTNDGRIFYMDTTINIKQTRAEHRDLNNIHTYGYIQALKKDGLNFEVQVIARRTKLHMCDSVLRDLLYKGKQTGAHLVNLASICRLYLDPQIM